MPVLSFSVKTCCETERHILGKGSTVKNASHIWRTVWEVASEALLLHCFKSKSARKLIIMLDVNVSRSDYDPCLQCGFGCWFSWQLPNPSLTPKLELWNATQPMTSSSSQFRYILKSCFDSFTLRSYGWRVFSWKNELDWWILLHLQHSMTWLVGDWPANQDDDPMKGELV